MRRSEYGIVTGGDSFPAGYRDRGRPDSRAAIAGDLGVAGLEKAATVLEDCEIRKILTRFADSWGKHQYHPALHASGRSGACGGPGFGRMTGERVLSIRTHDSTAFLVIESSRR